MSTQSEVVLLDGETGSTPIILYVTVETIKVSPQISLVWCWSVSTFFSYTYCLFCLGGWTHMSPV